MSEDKMRDDGFDQWWREYGQFCRAGGGQYEETFAYEAWKACAAIKDAEVAELKIQVAGWKYNWNESTDREIKLRKEIAARDLMIKDLLADVKRIVTEGDYTAPEGMKRIAADFMKVIPDCETLESLDNGWKCFGIAYLGCQYESKAEEVMAPALFRFVGKKYAEAEIRIRNKE